MKTLYIWIITSIVVFFSCTEDLPYPYEGKDLNYLAVEGYFTTDTAAQTVILTRTVRLKDTADVFETNATVTISDGINLFNLHEEKAGYYVTDSSVYGVPGRTYTLNIITADGKNYEAQSYLSPVSDIDSIDIIKEKFPFTNDIFYKVLFYGQEPEGEGDRYLWNVYVNDSLFNDTIAETRFEEDSWVDGAYLYDFDVYWIPEEDIRTDSVEITLEMESITDEYYNFLLQALMQTEWRGSPWDPIPANILTNVEGDEPAVGFFIAKAKTSISRTFYLKK